MASSLSNAFKALMVALVSASATRYKATLHNGAARPTVATAAYAAAGLGELATTGGVTPAYTAGGVGLAGGIQLNSVVAGDNLTFDDEALVTEAGETVGPVDTIAIWDTEGGNKLIAIIDLQADPQTASNGGTFAIDFAAATISFSVALA